MFAGICRSVRCDAARDKIPRAADPGGVPDALEVFGESIYVV